MQQREATVNIPLTPTRSDLYWRRIFNKYDKDNDGRISYVELRDIIESREYDHDLPDNVVEKIMSLVDRDNSGYLDFTEFVAMMHNPDLKAVFGHFVGRYIHSIIPHRGPVDTTGLNGKKYSTWIIKYYQYNSAAKVDIESTKIHKSTQTDSTKCW